MLEAMCNARFALLMVVRCHPSAGLIVTDMVREIDLWLVNEGLEISFSEGSVFATRYFGLDGFAMTTGVAIPLESSLLGRAMDFAPHLLRKPLDEAIEHRHFAEAFIEPQSPRG